MTPHSLIEGNPVVIINLERREDKKRYVTGEMERMGIKDYILFKAHDTKPGKIGCAKSHLDIMRWVKEEYEKYYTTKDYSFTIFEDDVKFLQPWSVINKAIDELPDDWDALFLGASPQQPQQRYSEHLFRLVNGKTTHAIIWNNKNGVIEYILDRYPSYSHLAIDRFFAEIIQPIFQIYIPFPLSCTQLQFQSDTCKRCDMSTIVRNYNKYCI